MCPQTDRGSGDNHMSVGGGPTKEELEGAESWMVDELKFYYQGRKRLADMMGKSYDTFTDRYVYCLVHCSHTNVILFHSDVEESLRYLLPSRLFAKDARPSMKVRTVI